MKNSSKKRKKLVNTLIEKDYLITKEVIRAFEKVPRHLFLPEKQRNKAYIDKPLPIGEEQTISAPHMVAILVEELKIEGNEKVLEIGTGSGYNAAIIAEVLDGGEVYSIERISSIADRARTNLKNTGYDEKVNVIEGDGSKGYELQAPYDRILLTAAAPEVPTKLEEQLKNKGKLVGPIGSKRNQKLIIGKKENGKTEYKEKGRCLFVPLKGKHGY